MTTTDKPKEFKPFKKPSPFSADPFNNRGQKGGNKGNGSPVQHSNAIGGKKISTPKFKGGSGGDR
jgi:hypothetical protein